MGGTHPSLLDGCSTRGVRIPQPRRQHGGRRVLEWRVVASGTEDTHPTEWGARLGRVGLSPGAGDYAQPNPYLIRRPGLALAFNPPGETLAVEKEAPASPVRRFRAPQIELHGIVGSMLPKWKKGFFPG